jgi:hypothetical protein
VTAEKIGTVIGSLGRRLRASERSQDDRRIAPGSRPRAFSRAGRRALSAGMSKRLDAVRTGLSIPERPERVNDFETAHY